MGVTGGNKGIQEDKGDYKQIHCTEGYWVTSGNSR